MADYISREDVIKKIAEKQDKAMYGREDVAFYQAIKIIREEPPADVQSVDRWISCKDKMPDDGVNVLIYEGNCMISLAWYDKDMGYFYTCDSDYSLDVTHWQPLPEPPKDGDTK